MSRCFIGAANFGIFQNFSGLIVALKANLLKYLQVIFPPTDSIDFMACWDARDTSIVIGVLKCSLPY